MQILASSIDMRDFSVLEPETTKFKFKKGVPTFMGEAGWFVRAKMTPAFEHFDLALLHKDVKNTKNK